MNTMVCQVYYLLFLNIQFCFLRSLLSPLTTPSVLAGAERLGYISQRNEAKDDRKVRRTLLVRLVEYSTPDKLPLCGFECMHIFIVHFYSMCKMHCSWHSFCHFFVSINFHCGCRSFYILFNFNFCIFRPKKVDPEQMYGPAFHR